MEVNPVSVARIVQTPVKSSLTDGCLVTGLTCTQQQKNDTIPIQIKKLMLTCSKTPPKCDLICETLPRPFTKRLGIERKRRVWPVGAVSNTTTENLSSFTKLCREQTNSHTYKQYGANRQTDNYIIGLTCIDKIYIGMYADKLHTNCH